MAQLATKAMEALLSSGRRLVFSVLRLHSVLGDESQSPVSVMGGRTAPSLAKQHKITEIIYIKNMIYRLAAKRNETLGNISR